MLISFLRSLYDQKQALVLEEVDYDKLLEEIELFSISSQVYHLLKDRVDQATPKLKKALEERYLEGLQQNYFMKVKEEELLRAFEERQLPVIPLKGTQFAERYFGHFAARVTGDFDLYIPKTYYQDAIECLETLGYSFEIFKDHHARLHRGELMVELHLTFDKPYWSELDPEQFRDTSERLEPYRSVRQLSVQNTFYFIALHGARHQMDSIRYLLDIVQILHRFGEQVDYDSLMRQAEKDKTSRRIETVLSIVYEQFPHLEGAKPLPFRPVKSRWNYASIRNAKLGKKDLDFYRYKLHFKHLIFDSWKLALISLKKSY